MEEAPMKNRTRRLQGKRVVVAAVMAGLLLAGTSASGTARADTATPGGGGHNSVQVINQVDGTLRVEGNVQLNRIPGPDVAPVNEAIALNSTCNGCQTIAVALQINLYGNGVSYFAPQNAATAINAASNGAFARADAFQCGIQVDDPTQIPAEVNQFVADMRVTLRTIQSTPGITVDEAQSEIQQVVDQDYDQLVQQLGALASCQVKYDVVTL
jgi:hypothetical protein